MKTLKMLIISHGFPPDMGGASNRAWNIAKALKSRGHEVMVLAAFPYYPHGRIPSGHGFRLFRKERIDGMDVLRVWVPKLRTVGLLNRLLIYLGFTLSYSITLLVAIRARLHILYYVSPYSLSFFSLPACLFGRMRAELLLLDLADLWPEVIMEVGGIRSRMMEELLVRMARINSRLCDFVTPITNSMKERTVQLGLPGRKIEVVELAVDTAFFRPRDKLDISDKRFEGKFIAEYSGILSPKYDFQSLLEAAKIVGEKTDRVLFLIRGDGEYRDFIVKSAGGIANVLVLTEIETLQKVVDYLNLADVLLCPLKDSREGSTIVPSKVIEYFAVAKPVICSARGETERVITESGSGIVVPPCDPKALAEAVITTCCDRSLSRRMGENARRLAETIFSLKNIGTKIENLYQRKRQTVTQATTTQSRWMKS